MTEATGRDKIIQIGKNPKASIDNRKINDNKENFLRGVLIAVVGGLIIYLVQKFLI